MDTIAEALEWAADYCERNKIFAPPLNKNGYAVDGWKGTPPEERASIIIQIAQTAFDNQRSEYTLMHARLSMLQALFSLIVVDGVSPAGLKIYSLMKEWGYAI